jgi:hypothetical protein
MLKRGFKYQPFVKKKGKLIPHSKTNKQQFETYLKAKKEGFKNPNTTDIHALKNISNTVNYVLKYMTKLEPTKRPIMGAVWGASNITKKLEYPTFYESQNAFDSLMQLISSKRLKCVLKDDFFSVHCGLIYKILQNDFNSVWQKVRLHYKLLKTYTKETYKSFEKEFKENKEKIKNKILNPISDITEYHRKGVLISQQREKEQNQKRIDYLYSKKIESNKKALQKFKDDCIKKLWLFNENQLKIDYC